MEGPLMNTIKYRIGEQFLQMIFMRSRFKIFDYLGAPVLLILNLIWREQFTAFLDTLTLKRRTS